MNAGALTLSATNHEKRPPSFRIIAVTSLAPLPFNCGTRFGTSDSRRRPRQSQPSPRPRLQQMPSQGHLVLCYVSPPPQHRPIKILLHRLEIPVGGRRCHRELRSTWRPLADGPAFLNEARVCWGRGREASFGHRKQWPTRYSHVRNSFCCMVMANPGRHWSDFGVCVSGGTVILLHSVSTTVPPSIQRKLLVAAGACFCCTLRRFY